MKAIKVDWNFDDKTRNLVSNILRIGGNICGGFPRYMSRIPEFRSWPDSNGDIDIYPSSEKNKLDLIEYLLSEKFHLEKN